MASWTEDELRAAVASSLCYADVLRRLSIVLSGATQEFIKKRMVKLGLDISHFDPRAVRKRSAQIRREASEPEIFCLNSAASQQTLRRAARHVIEYRCAGDGCGNMGTHCGRPLKLQLDHINGIRNDNRKENLRWMCPNCHTQTETYSRVKKRVPCVHSPSTMIALVCGHCGKGFNRRKARYEYTREWNQKKDFCSPLCNSLAQRDRRKVDYSRILQRYKETGSKNAVAKELGISFPTVVKALKSFEAPSSIGRISDSQSEGGEFDSPRGH